MVDKNYKYEATFKDGPKDNVDVYYGCTNAPSQNYLTHLGTLAPADQYGFEGELVFFLHASSIVEETGESIGIPANVLREIAEFSMADYERIKLTAAEKV